MDRQEHDNYFFNRAEVEEAERISCNKCFEPVVFMMRDKEHEFSIGLTTILECLTFAIQNGDLPKLPQSWLTDADSACGTYYALDERNCYFDSNFSRKR